MSKRTSGFITNLIKKSNVGLGLVSCCPAFMHFVCFATCTVLLRSVLYVSSGCTKLYGEGTFPSIFYVLLCFDQSAEYTHTRKNI